MNEIVKTILAWSEVWGILIPLTILILYKIKDRELKPVVLYIWVAAFLNIISRIIAELRKAKLHYHLPDFLQSNLLFYNLNSVGRVVLFTWFITNTKLLQRFRLLRLIIPVYIVLVLINFTFLEPVLTFSTKMYILEGILLLALCISFFLYSIKDESDIIWMDHPAFIVAAGVSLYEAISFFVFLFFDVISNHMENFGRTTMRIFSISYVILCILLAIVLFRARENDERKKGLT